MMGKWKFLLFLGAIVSCTCLIIRGCGKKETSAHKKEIQPVDIILNVIQGSEDSPSVFIVRLISQKAKQEAIDSSIKGKKRNATAEKTDSPFKLTANKGTWEKGISFYFIENRREARISSGVELLFYPKLKNTSIGPEDAYSIVYSIDSKKLPKAGSGVYAVMRLEKYSIKSNPVELKEEPSGKYDKLARQAEVYRALGDSRKLMDTAEKMIADSPSGVLGYWYKGLAFELKGDNKSAISMYETALKNVPSPKKGDSYEPPLFILEKIKYLSRK